MSAVNAIFGGKLVFDGNENNVEHYNQLSGSDFQGFMQIQSPVVLDNNFYSSASGNNSILMNANLDLAGHQFLSYGSNSQFTLQSGNLNVTSTFVSSGTLLQNGGTLDASGDSNLNGIILGNLVLKGGSFNSTPQNLTILAGLDFSGIGNGIFNPDNGTVILNPTSGLTFNPWNQTFNNLTFDKNISNSSFAITVASGCSVQTLTIQNTGAGTLTVSDNNSNGDTIQIQGNLNMGSGSYSLNAPTLIFNLAGNNGSFLLNNPAVTFGSELEFSGTGPGEQDFNNISGTFAGAIAVNKAGGSMKLLSPLTTSGGVGIVQGTFDWNNLPITMTNSNSIFHFAGGTMINTNANFTVNGEYLQDGGTFNGNSSDAGTIQFGSMVLNGGDFYSTLGTLNITGAYTQTAGIFHPGNSNLTIAAMNLTGGTFIAPTGNLTITSSIGLAPAGTFNANNGTLLLSPTVNTFTFNPNSKTFNNLMIDRTAGGAPFTLSMTSGCVVNNTLTIENENTNAFTISGGILNPTIQVQNNLSIPTTPVTGPLTVGDSSLTFDLKNAVPFDIANAAAIFKGVLKFSGNQNQTLSSTLGSFQGNIVVNKSAGSVLLGTNFQAHGTNELFQIFKSTIDLNGL